MKKKVLIPYASYGTGHKSIGEYIKKYLEDTGEYECMTLDLISFFIPFIGSISKKGSAFLMEKFPFIWSLLYFGFDNKVSSYISGNLTLKMLDNKDLKKSIVDFDPDITIATHFFGSDIINKYNKKGLTNSKLITVVTDYKCHDLWLKSLSGIDAIVVSSFEERLHLLKKGFKNSKIYTTGIPISPKMLLEVDQGHLYKKFKINRNKKTISFFSGGGNGSTINLLYFKELLINNYDCNVLFVAGRNTNVERKAKEYVKRYNAKNVHVFGFVTNVNEFYTVSDIVVTKPGGAQITECLLFKKPMILIKGNGGQEVENRRFLVRKGYARNTIGKRTFNRNVSDLLYNDDLRNKIVNNISKIEQNKSMEKLYNIVKKMI